jgi:hypothetical protein
MTGKTGSSESHPTATGPGTFLDIVVMNSELLESWTMLARKKDRDGGWTNVT